MFNSETVNHQAVIFKQEILRRKTSEFSQKNVINSWDFRKILQNFMHDYTFGKDLAAM